MRSATRTVKTDARSRSRLAGDTPSCSRSRRRATARRDDGMSPARPATVRVCVVAAHPDDETLGASAVFGWCDDVVVVHATNGAPRDPRWWPSCAADRQRYIQMREREAECALA